jgi:hypothetical protein
MRGEDGRDAGSLEKRVGFAGTHASLSHAAQGAAKIAALNRTGGSALAQLMGEATALAVVGLGKVDELEVEAEGPRKLIRSGKVESVHTIKSLLEMGIRASISILVRLRLTPCNRGAAQCFDGVIERLACLFAENFAEQHAERANVAAQRSFFQLASRGLKLCQALWPIGGCPKRRHD